MKVFSNWSRLTESKRQHFVMKITPDMFWVFQTWVMKQCEDASHSEQLPDKNPADTWAGSLCIHCVSGRRLIGAVRRHDSSSAARQGNENATTRHYRFTSGSTSPAWCCSRPPGPHPPLLSVWCSWVCSCLEHRVTSSDAGPGRKPKLINTRTLRKHWYFERTKML